MIAKGNKIMVLGGRDSSNVYHTSIEVLDWSNKLFKEVKQGLKKGRVEFGGAVEIPASLFNCPGAMQPTTTEAAPTCAPTPICPTVPEPVTCAPTPTCPTESGSIMTTTQMTDSCDDIGCKNAFNGLGMCVDTTSADFFNVSKTIDFAAGTKAGKCSRDCNCNCFKHTGCYSDRCDSKQGICLIPEQEENRGFFIPNEYKKAFPCDESLNCFCYIKDYAGVTTPSAGVTKPRSTPTCKPNKTCTKKNGKCFGKGDFVPENAKRKGWCNKKAGCKCYKV